MRRWLSRFICDTLCAPLEGLQPCREAGFVIGLCVQEAGQPKGDLCTVCAHAELKKGLGVQDPQRPSGSAGRRVVRWARQLGCSCQCRIEVVDEPGQRLLAAVNCFACMCSSPSASERLGKLGILQDPHQ